MLVVISVTATLVNAARVYARTLARRDHFGQDIWGSEDVGEGDPQGSQVGL